MNELPKRVLIVGLGLMGGGYAKALSKKGYQVYAISKEQDDINFAKSIDIIVDGQVIPTKEFVSSFELIVFALYPEIMVSWLKEYGDFLAKKTLLTDVTGVKLAIVRRVQETLKDKDVDFVFAHPMAGREKRGIAYADDAIFAKANFIVVPVDGNQESNLRLIEKLGKELGCRRIVRLSSSEHDEMIAYVSQLTHLIAVALMDAKDNTHLAEYTGDSFRDLTRIGQINEDMWSSLFLLNKEQLLKQTDLFIQELQGLRDAIANNDIETLKEKMKESTKRRAKFALDEEKAS